MIVYKITNKVNGRIYIGITRHHLATRWAQHKWYAANGSDSYLHRAIRKYGHSGFRVEKVYEGVSHSEIVAVEKGLIAQYGTTNRSIGYNRTAGGQGHPPGYRQDNDHARLLTEEAVRYIRDPKLSEVTNGSLRDLVETKFGVKVSRDAIRDARRGDTWDLPDCPPIKAGQGTRRWFGVTEFVGSERKREIDRESARLSRARKRL